MERYISKAVASAVRICIDEFHISNWKGRICTILNREEIHFQSTDELLSIMGLFWDKLGYPQESTICRSFTAPKQSPLQKQTDEFFQILYPKDGTQDKVKVEMVEDDMNKKHGDKGTFLVRIQYRQNASWQGQVTWVEENKTIPFRSALELIKLIDSTQEEKPNEWKTKSKSEEDDI